MRVEPAVPGDILAVIRQPLEARGAELAETPLLQPLNLLLDLAGEAMRARLFIVQSEGGTESCLRPDFTVAVAGQHIASGRSDGRYVYQGSAFRAAKGADRPEQFVQVGLEILSDSGDPLASDVEVACVAWGAASAGGRKDLSISLGDVALFSAFVESLELPEALAARLTRVAGRPRLLLAELSRIGQKVGDGGGRLPDLLSGLSTRDGAALLQEVWALAGVEPVGGRGPSEIAARLVRKAEAAKAPALTDMQASAIRAFMSIDDAPAAALATVEGLGGNRSAGLAVSLKAWRLRLLELSRVIPEEAQRFSPALGHAFEYYDGITFEVRSAAIGPERPVAVGGRYDGLISRLGGLPGAQAVGCMVRPWRAFAGGES